MDAWQNSSDCQGAWLMQKTLEALLDELQEVLEGWIILGCAAVTLYQLVMKLT